MLCDLEIRQLISDGVLDAQNANVGCVSCDLVCYKFHDTTGQDCSSYVLKPLQSVFVSSKESVHLPPTLTATIGLKNSRMRQGLLLSAPVYFPGHHTRLFFRLTNLSNEAIELQSGDRVAQVFFERCNEPESTYYGAFSDEFDYQGLSGYTDLLRTQTQAIEEGANTLKDMEKRIYTNVLTLIGIFVGIFSIVNINIELISKIESIRLLVVFDGATIGALAILVSLISLILEKQFSRHAKISLYIGLIAFVFSLFSLAL